MAAGRSQRTRPGAASRPERLWLVRSPGGGFQLEGEGGWQLSAVRAPGGFRVQGSAIEGWLLRKDGPEDGGGFVLLRGSAPDASEASRATHLPGSETGSGCSTILAGDGRLFRIVPRVGRVARYDLLGWEGRGAYLLAQRLVDGWRITSAVAGREIALDVEVLVVFGAEILDAEEPLVEVSEPGDRD